MAFGNLEITFAVREDALTRVIRLLDSLDTTYNRIHVATHAEKGDVRLLTEKLRNAEKYVLPSHGLTIRRISKTNSIEVVLVGIYSVITILGGFVGVLIGWAKFQKIRAEGEKARAEAEKARAEAEKLKAEARKIQEETKKEPKERKLEEISKEASYAKDPLTKIDLLIKNREILSESGFPGSALENGIGSRKSLENTLRGLRIQKDDRKKIMIRVVEALRGIDGVEIIHIRISS